VSVRGNTKQAKAACWPALPAAVCFTTQEEILSLLCLCVCVYCYWEETQWVWVCFIPYTPSLSSPPTLLPSSSPSCLGLSQQ
jgi:hypothetical protein